jgi:hypothetical protein
MHTQPIDDWQQEPSLAVYSGLLQELGEWRHHALSDGEWALVMCAAAPRPALPQECWDLMVGEADLRWKRASSVAASHAISEPILEFVGFDLAGLAAPSMASKPQVPSTSTQVNAAHVVTISACQPQSPKGINLEEPATPAPPSSTPPPPPHHLWHSGSSTPLGAPSQFRFWKG